MIAGTIICKECLDKAKKLEADTLKGQLAQAIQGEGMSDIYD